MAADPNNDPNVATTDSVKAQAKTTVVLALIGGTLTSLSIGLLGGRVIGKLFSKKG